MEVKAKVQAGGTTQRSLMENKVQKHTGSYLIPQRGLGSLTVSPLCLLLETSELLLLLVHKSNYH